MENENQNSTQPQIQKEAPPAPSPEVAQEIKKEKYIISIVVFILAIAVAYLAWYVNGGQKTPPPPAPVTAPAAEDISTAPSSETQASLGSDIYAQVENPIKGKLPDTSSVPNPIEGAYQNPFE